jgi:hypothetical protein
MQHAMVRQYSSMLLQWDGGTTIPFLLKSQDILTTVQLTVFEQRHFIWIFTFLVLQFYVTWLSYFSAWRKGGTFLNVFMFARWICLITEVNISQLHVILYSFEWVHLLQRKSLNFALQIVESPVKNEVIPWKQYNTNTNRNDWQWPRDIRQ